MNLSNESIEKKVTHTFSKIFIIIIIIFACVFGLTAGIFMYNLTPVDKKNNEIVNFNLPSGWGVIKTAKELKESGLIHNEYVFLIYSKMTGNSTFLAGNYALKKSMSTDEILKSISNGENIVKDTIVITFVEGRRFTEYAQNIESKLGIKAEDVIKKCKDKEYLKSLINKYWFITDEVLNDKLYYPLEGYLYPNTYEFYKNEDIESVIDRLLSETDKHLSAYKDDINSSKMSVHSLLTLASMVELEAVTSEDRLLVSGVFHNRLNNGISLGSDVTTYYAEQKKFTESINADIGKCNAYNTRGPCVKGLPVGPICNPSYTSIIAAINPSDTKYLYFIADKNNKLYYAETNEEHIRNYNYLKENNLYPE